MRGPVLALIVVLATFGGAVQAQPSAAGDFEVTDREGDVGVFGSPNPGSAPVAQDVDILGLRVRGEDMEGLWIELAVKQLRLPADAYPSANRRYNVWFGLESPALNYRVHFTPGGGSNATPDFRVNFCTGAKSGPCLQQRATASTDYARNTLALYVPKLSLMGRNTVDPRASSFTMPDVPLRAGDKLIDFRAESTGHLFLTDRAPDAGTAGPYVLRHAAANERIALSLEKGNETKESQRASPASPYGAADSGAFPTVAVEAGTPTPIKVNVDNHNGAKRVVNLTSSFGDAKAAGTFAVRLASNVAIPGNESRTMNLVVTTLTKVNHRDEALLRITANAAGFPDEVGAITVRLVASVPPSETKNVLHLHAATPDDPYISPFCAAPRYFGFICEPRLWMNTLQDDPQATADRDVVSGSTAFWSPQGWESTYDFALDAPLAKDVVLSDKLPVTSKIKVASAGSEGSIRVRLMAGDQLIGEGNQAIKPNDVTEVSFLPMLDATRIPAGSVLSYTVTLLAPYTNAPAAAQRPSLALRDSRLELPTIADPNRTSGLASSLGDAFLSLTVKGDGQDFVNPDEARAFHLTVLNEGSKDDVVLLAAAVDGVCRAEFRPGAKYRLDGGDSARVGLLVYAPAAPEEGAQCKVRVNATSSVDPKAVASRDLIVTITRGVDTPNDAENYTVNQDAASKLDEQRASKKSPTAGSWAVVAAAAVGLWAFRRRSHL